MLGSWVQTWCVSVHMWPDMCRCKAHDYRTKRRHRVACFLFSLPNSPDASSFTEPGAHHFLLGWLASKPKRSFLLLLSAPNHALWFQTCVTILSFYIGSGDLLLVWQNSLHVESYPQSIYKNLIFTPLRLKPILPLAEASLQHWGDYADTDQERRDL